MNPASIPEPAVEPVGGEAGSALAPPVAGPTGLARGMVWAIGAVATVALAASGIIWQKVSGMQEQLARQSADAGAASVEARAMARQAMEQTRETAARQALTEARLSEVSLQRTQLEELMQSLSRSRDENLVVDIESALRLAQQQAQLTGSVDPLLAALRSADQRIRRAGQPRLTPLQRAIGRDIDRIKSATLLTCRPCWSSSMNWCAWWTICRWPMRSVPCLPVGARQSTSAPSHRPGGSAAWP
jgi:uroporphyrin-3 C-methyltransferase